MAATTQFNFRLKDDEEGNLVQLKVDYEPLADFLLELLPKQDRVLELDVTRTETKKVWIDPNG